MCAWLTGKFDEKYEELCGGGTKNERVLARIFEDIRCRNSFCRLPLSLDSSRRHSFFFFFFSFLGKEGRNNGRANEIFDSSMTRRENDSHRDGTWHRVIIFAPSENQMRRHELIQPFPLSTSKPMRNCGRRFNESRSKCSFTWYSYFVWLDASNT